MHEYEKVSKVDGFDYEFVTMYRAVPLGVPRVIFDLIKSGASKINLYNMDFYTRIDSMYDKGYRKFDVDDLYYLSIHDPLINFRFLKRLMNTKMIDGDLKVKEILNWSDDQYVECLNIQLNNLSTEQSLS